MRSVKHDSEAQQAEATALLDALTPAVCANDHALKASKFAEKLRTLEGADPAAAASSARALCQRLHEHNAPKIKAQPYPEAVHKLTAKNFERIAKEIADGPDEDFSIESHHFRCNLRNLCFSRVPVGPEHLEIDGVPRSVAWQAGPKQALDFARLLVEAGGHAPFYAVHLGYGLDPTTFLLVYSKRAQERMFRTLAACLEMHPEIRGVLSGSWWHDPALDEVSPHMSYLRSGWTERGAKLFRWSEKDGAQEVAARNSPARRAAIESGEYTPTEHMVVWTRRSLLSWARSKG